MFVLVYTNEAKNAKRFNARKYYLAKGIIKDYNVIINGKNFMINQLKCHSDIKRHEEIRKLTTGQEEDYTTGCLLDYEYIKNHYRSIAVDLIRQKEFGADPKAIQQVEFIGQLKKLDDDGNARDAENDPSVLAILEKIKKTRLNLSQRTVTVL